MKKTKKGKDHRETTPETDPDVKEKLLIRRLEIQMDVLRKIIDPITEQLKEQENELTEAEIKSRRK